jgi:hypothetical protein
MAVVTLIVMPAVTPKFFAAMRTATTRKTHGSPRDAARFADVGLLP